MQCEYPTIVTYTTFVGRYLDGEVLGQWKDCVRILTAGILSTLVRQLVDGECEINRVQECPKLASCVLQTGKGTYSTLVSSHIITNPRRLEQYRTNQDHTTLAVRIIASLRLRRRVVPRRHRPSRPATILLDALGPSRTETQHHLAQHSHPERQERRGALLRHPADLGKQQHHLHQHWHQ